MHPGGQHVQVGVRPGPGLGSFALHDDPRVLGCGGRLDVEGSGPGQVVELVENGLESLGRGDILLPGAPHRDQEENLPEDDSQLRHEPAHGLHVVEVGLADHRVHLGGQADLLGFTEDAQAVRETAFHAAELVVNGRVGPVEADSQPAQACVLESLELFA